MFTKTKEAIAMPIRQTGFLAACAAILAAIALIVAIFK